MEEYFEMSIISPPCQCPICQDEAPPEADRTKYNCKYNNVHWPSANLFSSYKLIVLDNNTSLLDLPYEYYQVGRLHSYYTNMKIANDINKRKEKQLQEELFRKYAPKAK